MEPRDARERRHQRRGDRAREGGLLERRRRIRPALGGLRLRPAAGQPVRAALARGARHPPRVHGRARAHGLRGADGGDLADRLGGAAVHGARRGGQRRRRRLQLAARPAWCARRASRPRLHGDHEHELRAARPGHDRRRAVDGRGRRALGVRHLGRAARGSVRSSASCCSALPERTRPSATSSRSRCQARRMAGRGDWTRESLVAGVGKGDRRALARAISLVENGDPLAGGIVHDLYPTRDARARSASPGRRESASRASSRHSFATPGGSGRRRA